MPDLLNIAHGAREVVGRVFSSYNPVAHLPDYSANAVVSIEDPLVSGRFSLAQPLGFLFFEHMVTICSTLAAHAYDEQFTPQDLRVLIVAPDSAVERIEPQLAFNLFPHSSAKTVAGFLTASNGGCLISGYAVPRAFEYSSSYGIGFCSADCDDETDVSIYRTSQLFLKGSAQAGSRCAYDRFYLPRVSLEDLPSPALEIAPMPAQFSEYADMDNLLVPTGRSVRGVLTKRCADLHEMLYEVVGHQLNEIVRSGRRHQFNEVFENYCDENPGCNIPPFFAFAEKLRRLRSVQVPKFF